MPHFGLVQVEDGDPWKRAFTPYSEINVYTRLPTETIGFTFFTLLLDPQVLDTGRLWLLSVPSPLLIQKHNNTLFLKLFREAFFEKKKSYFQLDFLEKMDENINGSKVLLQKSSQVLLVLSSTSPVIRLCSK